MLPPPRAHAATALANEDRAILLTRVEAMAAKERVELAEFVEDCPW